MDIQNNQTQELFEKLYVKNAPSWALERDSDGSYKYHATQSAFSLFEQQQAEIELLKSDLAKAQAVPKWISVEDELPKDGAKVLCYGRQFMCVGVFDGDDFFDPLDGQSFVKDCVTHWMQLPASPKAQEPTND